MFIQDRIVGGNKGGGDKSKESGDRGQYSQIAVDENQEAPKVSRSDPESTGGRRRCCCVCFLLLFLCLGGAAFAVVYFGILDVDSFTAMFSGKDKVDADSGDESVQGNPPVAVPAAPPGGNPGNTIPPLPAPTSPPTGYTAPPIDYPSLNTDAPVGYTASPIAYTDPAIDYPSLNTDSPIGYTAPPISYYSPSPSGYGSTTGSTGTEALVDIPPASLENLIMQFSPYSDIDSPSSAAYKAFQWMTTNDQYIHSGLLGADETFQRFVFITLYFSLNGPDWNSGGSGTTSSSKWNLQSLIYQQNHICDWSNVNCSADLLVTSLTLTQLFRDDSTHRISRIPSEVGLLSTLTNLEISRSNIVGAIPQGLGSLTQLSKLDLSNNALMGSLPSSLSSLTRLTALRLFNNQLTGSVPSLGFEQISGLEELMLYGNPSLSGQMNVGSTCSGGAMGPATILIDCDPSPTVVCSCCQGVRPTAGPTCLIPTTSCSRVECCP
jgi:hypothetical protein